MDVFQSIKIHPSTIRTVEMHTSGEPTRIIISGFPPLKGETLLEKRRYARENHQIDRVRKWLMLEPRGHQGMYGAILVKETELTKSGEADIGVLFCHNEGYSTMCGHATIALGRFLIDTHDLDIFPRRAELQTVELPGDDDNIGRNHSDHNSSTIDGSLEKTTIPTITATILRLHAPCGIITITVPISNPIPASTQSTTHTTYTTLPSTKTGIIPKPIRFRSIPCFVSSPARGITISVPREMAWPKLLQLHTTRRKSVNQNQSQDSEPQFESLRIQLDISYGGAFYAFVSSSELGFPSLRVHSESSSSDYTNTSSDNNTKLFKELTEAARILRILINQNPQARESFTHCPDIDPSLGFLYGVTIIDSNSNFDKNQITWLCFFSADSQIDRSPTGSCVSAHVPLAISHRGQPAEVRIGEWCTYESFLSVQFPGNAFRGRAVERVQRSRRETLDVTAGFGKRGVDRGGRSDVGDGGDVGDVGDVGDGRDKGEDGRDVAYIIEIEGYAHYTGTASFVPPEENLDNMGNGFELKLPSSPVAF